MEIQHHIFNHTMMVRFVATPTTSTIEETPVVDSEVFGEDEVDDEAGVMVAVVQTPNRKKRT